MARHRLPVLVASQRALRRGVTYRLVMSDVEAPGFLGFFYRRFGSAKTGNAFLAAHAAHFEQQKA